MNISRSMKRTRTICTFNSMEQLSSILEGLNLKKGVILLDRQINHVDVSRQNSPVRHIDVSLPGKAIIDSLKMIKDDETCDSFVVIGDQNLINYAKLTAMETGISLIVIPSSFIACNSSNDIVSFVEDDRLHQIRHESMIPRATVIDESITGLPGVKNKSIEIYALSGALIDAIAVCEIGSYQYDLCLEGFRLCIRAGTAAAHSQHDHDSRQQIATASHLLSLAKGDLSSTILDTAATALSHIGQIPYSTAAMILFPYILEVLISRQPDIFASFYSFFNEGTFSPSSCSAWLLKFTNTLVSPIAKQIPYSLYDLDDRDFEKKISIPSLERIAKITAESRCVCSYSTLFTKQEIIDLMERAYWGYQGRQEAP
ncbi:MAG: hypothetical protein ACPKOP_03075 [Sphaerochaetaceae bacterium]